MFSNLKDKQRRHLDRVYIHLDSGNPDEAATALRSALGIDPHTSFAEALNGRDIGESAYIHFKDLLDAPDAVAALRIVTEAPDRFFPFNYR